MTRQLVGPRVGEQFSAVVISADIDLRRACVEALTIADVQVRAAADGQSGLSLLRCQVPDLVIATLRLPDLSTGELFRRVREDVSRRRLPILVVADDEHSAHDAVTSGADDFVLAPVHSEVLVSRARTLVRRTQLQLEDAARGYSNSGLQFDLSHSTVSVDGTPVPLTPTERRILQQLVASAGEVLSRAALVSGAIGESVGERTIDVHVRGLRRKLRRYSDMIETVRGLGYRMATPRET